MSAPAHSQQHESEMENLASPLGLPFRKEAEASFAKNKSESCLAKPLVSSTSTQPPQSGREVADLESQVNPPSREAIEAFFAKKFSEVLVSESAQSHELWNKAQSSISPTVPPRPEEVESFFAQRSLRARAPTARGTLPVAPTKTARDSFSRGGTYHASDPVTHAPTSTKAHNPKATKLNPSAAPFQSAIASPVSEQATPAPKALSQVIENVRPRPVGSVPTLEDSKHGDCPKDTAIGKKKSKSLKELAAPFLGAHHERVSNDRDYAEWMVEENLNHWPEEDDNEPKGTKSGGESVSSTRPVR